jgi:serine phosphatase RsbU (regulator of sigma subunit)
LELAAAHLGSGAALYLVEGGKLSAVGRAWRDQEKGVVLGAADPDLLIGDEPGERIAKRAMHEGERRGLDGAANVLVLPLSLAGRTQGVLIVSEVDPLLAARSGGRVSFPREVARRMARSLENARAYRDRDHVARTLQNSLLPPTLPQVPNLDIAAVFKPALSAYDIGGDFYDVFQTPEGRWAAVIGDVCGKGIEAAALTSLARYTLRAAFRRDSPSDVLRTLNEALLQQELDGKFCTVCLVLVEPSPTGSDVIVSSAGHPLPQLVRPDGSARSVGEHGTLLGVTEDVRLSDVHARLAPDETLVLYTDGLLPRARQHLDEADQLREVFEPGNGGDGGDGVKERVERYVEELTGDQQDDDVAVLLLTARSGG